MANRHKGMVKHHARPAVCHDFPDPLAHGRFVALDGAGIACALVLMRASLRSFKRVLYNLEALTTELFAVAAVRNMAVAMAVDTCHGHQGALVFSQIAFTLAVCVDAVSHAGPFSRRCA